MGFHAVWSATQTGGKNGHKPKKRGREPKKRARQKKIGQVMNLDKTCPVPTILVKGFRDLHTGIGYEAWCNM